MLFTETFPGAFDGCAAVNSGRFVVSSAEMIVSHHAVLAMTFLANFPAARYAAGTSLPM